MYAQLRQPPLWPELLVPETAEEAEARIKAEEEAENKDAGEDRRTTVYYVTDLARTVSPVTAPEIKIT